jgi:hypothetical protein
METQTVYTLVEDNSKTSFRLLEDYDGAQLQRGFLEKHNTVIAMSVDEYKALKRQVAAEAFMAGKAFGQWPLDNVPNLTTYLKELEDEDKNLS